MRWLTLVSILLLALLAPRAAAALTQPLPGGVAWPNTTPLQLPFPAGTSVYVTSGYGPAMGSSLHDGLANTSSANDYYALDLVYANEANGGFGMPVVAALSGTVVKAGWATAGWGNYGQRVILSHDIGDGHIYVTHYAHLNSIDAAVVVGATISQGQVIGTLGKSCDGDNMQLDCPSFGPHLHFGLHRDSSVGGSGTGGSYGGNAVVPEPISGVEDIVQGMTITSTNAGTVSCGDGYCSMPDEDHGSCPADCPACTLIPPAGAVIDESEAACFGVAGTPSYWHDEGAGYLDSLKWTTATDAASVDNVGTWSFTFEEAGQYRLEVYTDAGFAQSQAALYAIQHDGMADDVTIDQSAVDGWQTLGELAFAAGGSQHLQLADVTGEPVSEGRQLVFDAVRLTRLDGGGGAGGSSAGVGGGAAGTGGGADSTPEASAGDAGGCGCQLPGAGGRTAPLGGLWLLAALALLRHRRHAQSIILR